jgi:hypothetical protein
MLMRATRASHVEQWLLEVRKADVVDSERSISSNNLFADALLLDRTCEGIVLPLCGSFGVEEGYFRHREAAKESGWVRIWKEGGCGEYDDYHQEDDQDTQPDQSPHRHTSP